MGQKAHPIGQRLGFIKGWDSNWYGGKNYADKLVEDEQIRQYLMARLKKASVSQDRDRAHPEAGDRDHQYRTPRCDHR
jgi:hypothetical protein